jgi:nitrogen fixation/metabolism regulation signal transduction histidine kinase
MSKNPPAFKRKNYFIADGSQLHILVSIEIIFIFLLLISSAILFLAANRDLQTTYFQAHLNIRNVQQILLPVLVIANLFGLGLSIVLMIFFTHRIAGAAYRLSTILKQIGDGSFPKQVKLRKNDELKELESAASYMLIALQNRIVEMKAIQARLTSEVQSLETSKPGLKTELMQVREDLTALEKEFSYFQIPDQGLE